jgi:hypothetical protein
MGRNGLGEGETLVRSPRIRTTARSFKALLEAAPQERSTPPAPEPAPPFPDTDTTAEIERALGVLDDIEPAPAPEPTPAPEPVAKTRSSFDQILEWGESVAQPAPEPRGKVAELELCAHFQGRRTGERKRVRLKVKLSTPRGTLLAETVDISMSGALFALQNNDGGRAFGPNDVDKLCMFVERYLVRGLEVYFGGGIVKRRLQVVRTTMGGLGRDTEPLLGCSFSYPLRPEECELLGIGDVCMSLSVTDD